MYPINKLALLKLAEDPFFVPGLAGIAGGGSALAAGLAGEGYLDRQMTNLRRSVLANVPVHQRMQAAKSIMNPNRLPFRSVFAHQFNPVAARYVDQMFHTQRLRNLMPWLRRAGWLGLGLGAAGLGASYLANRM